MKDLIRSKRIPQAKSLEKWASFEADFWGGFADSPFMLAVEDYLVESFASIKHARRNCHAFLDLPLDWLRMQPKSRHSGSTRSGCGC